MNEKAHQKLLDDLLPLARSEDTGERWKGDIAMRAHDALSALPPLRAREEIARITAAAFYNDPDQYGRLVNTEAWNRVGDAILSRTAGQEWREPEGWRKTLENAALFLEIGAGYAPNEVVDERIKETKERLKLRGLRDVMRAVAKDCRAALLPAPPVAEPLVAEQRPETKDVE